MFINFSDLPSTQKGNIGEHLIDGIIASTGSQIYISQTTNCSHYLDRFYITKSGRTFAADAKAKVARSAYPDSGVDRRHYETYKKINENTPFIIYFVDEYINSVYGNYLNILMEPRNVYIPWRPGYQGYPYFDNHSAYPMVYFPLENMIKFGNINESISSQLRSLSNRNYAYPKYKYPDWLY